MTPEKNAEVRWHEEEDRFTIEISRHDLDMLQRLIQRSPYEPMRGLWTKICWALCLIYGKKTEQ
jgi:hypothetical protein